MKKIRVKILTKTNLLIISILGVLGMGASSCRHSAELEPDDLAVSDTMVHCMYGVLPAPFESSPLEEE